MNGSLGRCVVSYGGLPELWEDTLLDQQIRMIMSIQGPKRIMVYADIIPRPLGNCWL